MLATGCSTPSDRLIAELTEQYTRGAGPGPVSQEPVPEIAGPGPRRIDPLPPLLEVTEPDEPLEPDVAAAAVPETTPVLPLPPPISSDNGVLPDTPEAPDRPMAPSRPTRSPERRRALTVQPESVVEIAVAEDSSLDGFYEVNKSSAIEFKYVGLVFLADLTEEDAAAKIERTLLDRGFRSAGVKVRIVKASYDKVRVSGAIVGPADLKIGPGSSISLSEALRRAGGLRPQAKGAKIKIVRDGVLSPFGIAAAGTEYSLVSESGDPTIPDVKVSNNDWVHVFQGSGNSEGGLGEKQILLLGEVRRPGVIRFAANEPCTMMHLMFKIGGLPKWADNRNVVIVRPGANETEQEIEVDVRDILKEGDPAEDVPLQNGDRVIVKERRLLF